MATKKANKARPVPEGYHTLTPGCAVREAAQAIDWYKRAFGAEERFRFEDGGRVVHAELRLGDSVFMLSEPMGGPPYAMHVAMYVEHCDEVVERAVSAGASVKQAVTDQFYGDRAGTVVDPFGNEWWIATHIEDVDEPEMRRRMEALQANQPTR
jgi:PhnB protein